MGTLGIATLSTNVDLRGLDKGLKTAEGKTRQSTKKTSVDLEKVMGATVAAVTVAAVGAIATFVDDSITQFTRFEAGFSEVMTLLPGLTAEATDSMQADLLAFGTEAGRLTTETVPALYQSISAGVPRENVFDFLSIASDAALGGVTTLEIAVDGITSVVNAYGAETVDAQQASDLLFTAVKGGKTTFEELSRSIFQVTPVASSLNVEFGNVTAAMAALTAQGVPTSVAATRLRQLLVELSKESSQASKTFERVAGVGFKQFIAEGGNLQDALVLMEEEAQNLNTDISNLFSSVEAGGAALALTGKGATKFANELDAAKNSAGATAEAAATMNDSLQQAERLADAATEELKILIGEGLAPTKKAWLELKTSIIGATSEYLKNERAIKAADEQTRQLAQSLLDLDDGTFRAEDAVTRINEKLAPMAGSLEDAEIKTKALTVAQELLTNNGDLTGRQIADLSIAIAENGETTRLLVDDVIAASLAEKEHATAIEGTAVATEAATRSLMTYQELLLQGEVRNEELGDKLEQTNAHWDEQEAFINNANAANAAYFAGLDTTTSTLDKTTLSLESVNSQLGNYFIDALTATEQTSTLEEHLFTLGQEAELSASDLAFLATATGNYTAEQIQAAIEAAVFEEKLVALIAQVKDGTINIDEATEAAGRIKANMDLSVESAVALTTSFGGTSEKALALKGDMGELDSAMGGVRGQTQGLKSDIDNIPRNIDIKVNFQSQGVSSAGGAGGIPIDAFNVGGFTGRGSNSDVAGFVHKNEFVFSAPAVESLGVNFLDFLHNASREGRTTSSAAFLPQMATPAAANSLSGSGGDTFIYQDNRQVVTGDDSSLEAFRLMEAARGTS